MNRNKTILRNNKSHLTATCRYGSIKANISADAMNPRSEKPETPRPRKEIRTRDVSFYPWRAIRSYPPTTTTTDRLVFDHILNRLKVLAACVPWKRFRTLFRTPWTGRGILSCSTTTTTSCEFLNTVVFIPDGWLVSCGLPPFIIIFCVGSRLGSSTDQPPQGLMNRAYQVSGGNVAVEK